MPRNSKKSTIDPTQQTRTFSCPVQGCRTQIRSCWGFTQHVRVNHPGMDLQYPGLGNEDKSAQSSPSSDHQTSSPPLASSPNTFFQDDHAHDFTDWGVSDYDLDGDSEPIPTASDSLPVTEHDSGDDPAVSTEFHPHINGMYNNYVILVTVQLLIKCL